jgi:hypothetical protein
MEIRSSIVRASNYLDERYYPVSHHLFHAILFIFILLAALSSSIETSQVAIFGHKIPPLCMFKRILDLDCPGCGITRSFVFAVHREWYASYMMHIWGIPLAGFLVFQVFYRFSRAFKSPPIKINPAVSRWLKMFLVLSILLPWIVKTTYSLASRL